MGPSSRACRISMRAISESQTWRRMAWTPTSGCFSRHLSLLTIAYFHSLPLFSLASIHFRFLSHTLPFKMIFFVVYIRKLRNFDLALENQVSYESLWNAGFKKDELNNSNTGVFVGCCTISGVVLGIDEIGPFTNIGNAPSGISGRVSHALGLKGPSALANALCRVPLQGSTLLRIQDSFHSSRGSPVSCERTRQTSLVLAESDPVQTGANNTPIISSATFSSFWHTLHCPSPFTLSFPAPPTPPPALNLLIQSTYW